MTAWTSEMFEGNSFCWELLVHHQVLVSGWQRSAGDVRDGRMF
jgi:hypothetical protein